MESDRFLHAFQLRQNSSSFFVHDLFPVSVSCLTLLVSFSLSSANQSSMMWRYAVIVLLVLQTVEGISVYTNYGSKRVKFGDILSFHVSSKGEMNCFYEELKTNSTIKATLSAVDNNQHEVHMRISSPSGDFSEWKHEMNTVYFETTAAETGVYEFCATAKVGYMDGKVRMNLQLLMYLEADIQEIANERREVVGVHENVKNKINMLVTKIYRLIFLQKQRAETTIKDEMMQIANGDYVYYFSLLQIVVILSVGLGQTVAIRRFFNSDGRKVRI